jgi:hypothetical protein
MMDQLFQNCCWQNYIAYPDDFVSLIFIAHFSFDKHLFWKSFPHCQRCHEFRFIESIFCCIEIVDWMIYFRYFPATETIAISFGFQSNPIINKFPKQRCYEACLKKTSVTKTSRTRQHLMDLNNRTNRLMDSNTVSI